MDPLAFAASVTGWHDFYFFVGTAAATLVGLLFVAISLSRDKLNGAANSNKRLLAYRTFYTFIYMLVIAGVMLVPQQSPLGTGLPLLAVAALGLINSVRNVRAMSRDSSQAFSSLLRRFTLIILSMGVLAAVAIGLLAGAVGALYWLTAAVLSLLVSASENAWDLLMGLD